MSGILDQLFDAQKEIEQMYKDKAWHKPMFDQIMTFDEKLRNGLLRAYFKNHPDELNEHDCHLSPDDGCVCQLLKQ